MKYDVSINDGGITRYFRVDINRQNIDPSTQNLSRKCTINTDNNPEVYRNTDSAELLNMCLEISRTEYEHSFRRAERLDNKIYILLTVCAFIFVVLISAIDRVSEYDMTEFDSNILIGIYDVLLISCIAETVIMLGALIYSLSGVGFKRYDSNLILERNMLSADMKKVTRFTIIKYENARDHNNKVVTKRYSILNFCVCILIILVVTLIIITFIGNFLPSRSDVSDQKKVVLEIDEEVENISKDMNQIVESIIPCNH